MKTDEVRQRFLDFFKGLNHKIIRSDSLVPESDPTLLFTGAGMNQFKDYFLGLKGNLKRAASCQKCLRTGDLDEVGRTAYHHSFFEMLGNFSFGDYFKKEAIRWAWEFLTREMGLASERLRVSVHHSDKEAYDIWKNEMGVREDWISRLGDKTNFWPANAPKDGPNGPCGPCSEIYYDQGEDFPGERHACSIEHDCGRYTEVWNLVFTQFNRQTDGKLEPLAQKNIDTGMGLERLACVIQGKRTNFEIDIFQPITEAVRHVLGIDKLESESAQHVYAISDHARAVAFAIADGVIPSNEGRGYVIRKLIRRALWRAHQLKKSIDPFLYSVVPVVVEAMGKAYPDLIEAEGHLRTTIKGEEERFLETLETGLQILNERIEQLKRKKAREISGELVFELYDTYGFPDELTRSIAQSEGFLINQEEFNRLIESQRQRAKDASRISGTIFVTGDLEKKISTLPPTRFLGYQQLETEAVVLYAELGGREGVLILDETPFYAESGGQVGDQGVLENERLKARVIDTQKRNHCFIHSIELEKGNLKAGDKVRAKVDRNRRDGAMRNHTATHLLHAVLREILGKQVRQLGSLVAPERLRFDYSFHRPLQEEELSAIERRVNEEILKDTPLAREEKGFEEAKKEGALAFFGEKYGDRVRVVTIPGISKEFCGGTHCERTGQIGVFIIVNDSSIASGVRRIEALTGEGALRYVRVLRSQVEAAARTLRTTPGELIDRIGKIQERLKKLEKTALARGARGIDASALLQRARLIKTYRVLIEKFDDLGREDLRGISDALRSQARESLWVLFCGGGQKIHFLVGLSSDLKDGALDARDVAKGISTLLKGSSGGRQDLAEGGGTHWNDLGEDWPATEKAIIKNLQGLVRG